MNVEELKSVIVSQRQSMEELFREERIIERDLDLDKIRSMLTHPNILAILGIRRCGKSVFTWLLLDKEKFGYINFFDERLSTLRVEEASAVLQAISELYSEVDYFVFDEVQKLQDWERFVTRMRTSKRIVITGSNSGLLRNNLSTFITGRHLDVIMFPFSFKEYLLESGTELNKSWQHSVEAVASVKRELSEYMAKGGFPEVRKFGTRILQTIFRDILENDVVAQHRIRNKNAVRELSLYLASNICKEVSFERMTGFLGIKNGHTIAKYIGYLEEAYMIFLLQRFSFKLKSQFIAPRKVYFVDTGLANSVAFKLSTDIGRQMENLVFVELLRRAHYQELNEELYYWKDHRGREVDFIIRKDNRIVELIQVSYISSRSELPYREINGLILASNELKCTALTIITWDYNAEETVKGKAIRFVPMWRWLLQPEYNSYVRQDVS